MAVSVVLFGTLLEAGAPANPAAVLLEAVDCVGTVGDPVHVCTDPERDRVVKVAGARFLDASGRPQAAIAADREVAP